MLKKGVDFMALQLFQALVFDLIEDILVQVDGLDEDSQHFLLHFSQVFRVLLLEDLHEVLVLGGKLVGVELHGVDEVVLDVIEVGADDVDVDIGGGVIGEMGKLALLLADGCELLAVLVVLEGDYLVYAVFISLLPHNKLMYKI